MDWLAIWLTLKLAFFTTLILLVGGLPIGYWLATTHSRSRLLIEAIVTLPLVLPPTVLGFYLLTASGPHSWAGQLFESLTGSRIPFTFAGILAGSVIVNLPFAVRPFTAAFASLDPQLLEASWCLGESKWNTLRRIGLPLCWPGILSGIILTFAHTVGEFGVVLMIGGNLPGVTRTLSISIYDDVQALDYAAAGQTSLLLLSSAIVTLLIAHSLSPRGAMRQGGPL